nr:hypothetical protein [Streptomyces antibioticus]
MAEGHGRVVRRRSPAAGVALDVVQGVLGVGPGSTMAERAGRPRVTTALESGAYDSPAVARICPGRRAG